MVSRRIYLQRQRTDPYFIGFGISSHHIQTYWRKIDQNLTFKEKGRESLPFSVYIKPIILLLKIKPGRQ